MDFASRFLLCAPFALAGMIAAATAQDVSKSGAAQSGATQSGATKLVPGFYDPKTQTFTPLPPSSVLDAGEPASRVVLTGKLTVEAVVTLKSPIPKTATFSGIGSIFVDNDPVYTNGVGSEFKLTRVGTTGAKGKVSLTYKMAVSSKSEAMTVQLTVVVNSATGPRPFVQNKQFIPLPANKATTVVVFPVTL
jgi:hypothetical protein